MNILRDYRHFINEAVDSDKELNSLNDVPNEVIETAKKIALDMFDKVRKPTFEFVKGQGLTMKFFVTEQDFKYIDEDSNLTLNVTKGAKLKRMYDVSLIYLDRITETLEVEYLVSFNMLEESPSEDDFDEDDEDVIVDDDYENIDPDDVYFDEDEADMDIKKGKIKLSKEDERDLTGVDDDVYTGASDLI
jgi:hypothetical protein